MQTKFIEAVNGTKEARFNWGKFAVMRFDSEWAARSAVDGCPLLAARGWSPEHLFVLDLQTGEGAFFLPGGKALYDLKKRRIWTCPLFLPFLEWLYSQDTSDLNALPALVELPNAPGSLVGLRWPGGLSSMD